MERDSLSQRKAQLDKAEREHLEDIVEKLRSRVEDNVRFQLTQKGLDTKPEDRNALDKDTEQLVEAIDIEGIDGYTWEEAFEKYIAGVGYTIVNRLAALRCMEVRDFIDEEVTVFKENGLTPAAETLVHEEFLLEDEAILSAYHNACDELADEIEILFDRSSTYSLIDPDEDTFEELCDMLDEISDEVWRADDVLGWVYEYYNIPNLAEVRKKARLSSLDPEDVPAANQFYTPHWVVRMLTDNSLGKMYLEGQGKLSETVEYQKGMSPGERKQRALSPDKTPTIGDFCTYLVPSEGESESPEFSDPADIQVIDPACGSGHFLLYAFDVLERIWRAETDVAHEEIPRRILKNNLYGVDLDMRACQLAAFNLYLKGRSRAEDEGADGFDMPQVGIVCADAKVADMEGVEDVFDEVAEGRSDIRRALETILDAFEDVHGLGSLLDVRGTLDDVFTHDIATEDHVQITLADNPNDDHTLSAVLHSLREAVEEHRNGDSFLAQDLRSFVRLLDVLAQDYDVALMNPPYGTKNKMPKKVTEYVEKHYNYTPEFYINFLEVCENLLVENGRTGMLTPRSFMFNTRFVDFREDFVGDRGSFDFLAEFGLGILDNATVRTVGTIIRKQKEETDSGQFIRLYDVDTTEKESVFLSSIFSEEETDITRQFHVSNQAFQEIPGKPICYSVPDDIRKLHTSKIKLDPSAPQFDVDGDAVATVAKGMDTGNNQRFIREHWEVDGSDSYVPYAKGGTDAWVLPNVTKALCWGENGEELRASESALLKNEDLFFREGITWTYVKETGRRFGYFPPDGVFDGGGSMLFSEQDQVSNWLLMGALNSAVYHILMLSLTPERNWQVGHVGRLPWIKNIEELDDIESTTRTQYKLALKLTASDPTSPYYTGPLLLPSSGIDDFLYRHRYTQAKKPNQLSDIKPARAQPISEACQEAIQNNRRMEQEMEALATKIDKSIFNELNIDSEIQDQILTEIALRTSENPEDRKVPDPESVPEVPENLNHEVKLLVHHFAIKVTQEDDDGVVPLQDIEGVEDSMFDRIVEKFIEIYGEYAEDRLVEVDGILGDKTADEEPYPNLREWLQNDLFQFHVETMENTPIIWKLTTERLVSDPLGEGFACFVDYHRLDSGVFDRLTKQYLEPRKAELRERRSAANRRRSDDSLSPSEQAEAAEEHDRCASGLDQIVVFEDVMQNLASTTQREFDDDSRRRAEELAPKVAEFREETRKRVDALAQLHERNTEDWFKDTFSNKFWETVEKWCDEWIGALDDLEYACEAYTRPANESVEAHLADLFDYFNWRLKGSDHYSSSGILFMTYYFEREGADLLDDEGKPFDTLTEDERLLASLATGLDDPSIVDVRYLETMADDVGVEKIDDLPPLAEFKALAEEIDDRCQTIRKRISSDWTDRALSEIMTEGYQPNQKHGVEINITPLAQAEIVPKKVEDDVL